MIQLHPNTNQAYQLLHDGTLALARAERQGIRVDVDYLKKKAKHLTRKIDYLEDKLMTTKFYRRWSHTVQGKPNMHSDPQLRTYLYSVLKLEPSKKTKTGMGSTDEEALLDLGIPEMRDLIQIKKLKNMRDTFLAGFEREQVDGYIHPFFNLNLVTTFRSSSDRPNFQNIPNRDKELMKLTRSALYPRPGHQLLEMDFSGLEVCIAACYHKDPTMIKYIKDPTSDMHGDMAAQLYMIDNFNRKLPEHNHLRKASKNGFVFPQFYGDYSGNCADYLTGRWGELPHGKWKPGQGVRLPEGHLSDHLISKGYKNVQGFADHVKRVEQDFWENRFPVYAKWKDSWWAQYQKLGYLHTKTGFTCSGVMSKNDAINYPVQGAAFHGLLWSFIRLDALMYREGWKSRLIGQVHDSIVFDIYPPELEMVLQIAKRTTTVDLPKHWTWINVPLNIDAELCGVDESWANKKEIEIP